MCVAVVCQALRLRLFWLYKTKFQTRIFEVTMRFFEIADVAEHYRTVEAGAAYAKFFNPDSDDDRQARIESQRKRRIRKPTLRSVLAQAARAGVGIAAVQVNSDGSITITPGTPVIPVADIKPSVTALDGSEWN
jgi:hypothetical protein